MLRYRFLLVIATFFIPLASVADEDDCLLRSKMLADLDTITELLSVRYGPREWKYSHDGWTLEKATEEAKQGVLSTEQADAKHFHRIVQKLCYSMNDYHTAATFYSTEMAFLPFDIISTEGRYFVSAVDRSFLRAENLQLSVGDEVLTLDGRPVEEVVGNILTCEQRNGNRLTDQRLAEQALTQRYGALGQTVWQGPLSLTLREPSGREKRIDLSWEYYPERIYTTASHLRDSHSAAARMRIWSSGTGDLRTPQQKIASLLFMHAQGIATVKGQGYTPGSLRGFLPPLGPVIWNSDDHGYQHYFAYIFQSDSGNHVGYLRIPTYLAGLDDEIKELRRLMEHFLLHTEMLVLDQTNNLGGYPLYAFALLSTLTDKPLSTPKERWKLTQLDIWEFLEIDTLLHGIQTEDQAQELFGEELLGYPVTLDFVTQLRRFSQFVIQEWQNGKSMTDLTHMIFVDAILPCSAVQYHKPLLCLINELDLSCADLVPAILQDNKRAVLMGTRTAGAGGIVKQSRPTTHFGIESISHTVSISERSSSLPIEGLGVTPDVPYSLSLNDLRYGFHDYKKAINQQIESILNDHLDSKVQCAR